LPPALVEHRRRLATHMVLAALADLEAKDGDPDESLIADLIEVVVALYSIPASHPKLTSSAVRGRPSKGPRRRTTTARANHAH
jgi:hypothetical protein